MKICFRYKWHGVIGPSSEKKEISVPFFYRRVPHGWYGTIRFLSIAPDGEAYTWPAFLWGGVRAPADEHVAVFDDEPAGGDHDHVFGHQLLDGNHLDAMPVDQIQFDQGFADESVGGANSTML
jgi:hypothetical protein